MTYRLFSATGCMRCRIVKSYLDQNQLAYAELDIKAQGKDAFKSFYRQNRSDIIRGEDGIEFPILHTGDRLFQGMGGILAFLMAENRLDGFVKPNTLGPGWINGLNIWAGPCAEENVFPDLLRFIKDHGVKIQQPAVPPAPLNVSPLPPSAFFKYRTRCRRYMISAEIMSA